MPAPLLLVVLLLSAAPAPKPPFTLTLDVQPEHAAPGEPIYWVARLRNTTGEPVFIPADTRRFLSVFGHHHRPDDTSTYGFGSGGFLKNPPPVTEWQRLEPGAELELAGSAGDIDEACRKGCPEGTLGIEAMLNPDRPPGSPGTDETHLVPGRLEAHASVAIGVTPVEVLERRDVDALEARVLDAANRDGHARLRLRLINRTTQPLWIPAHVALDADCVMTSDDGGSGTSAKTLPSRPSWNEKSAVLLKPGGSHETAVTCEDVLPARGSVEVRLRPAGAYESSRPLVPPFVWTGEVKAPVFRVGGAQAPQK